MNKSLMQLMCVGAATAMLSACGGGGGGGGAAAPEAAVTSSGAMTRGSVILNGTRFDDSTSSVTDDRGRSTAQLEDGMVVRLRGRSDDGITGVAERIDLENEVRGAIQSLQADATPQRFTVGGLVVLVDSETVFSHVAGFGALAAGVRVEVHGLRDAAGQLHATRVEVGAEGVDELRGAASNVDPAIDRFTLNGNVTVNYAGAVFNPPGSDESALTAGRIVEVRGSLTDAVFTATEVDIEDLEDDSFRGGANERHEVEGFVGSFAGHPGSFQVAGRTVQTTTDTRFERGTAEDLVNGAKVEAEGVLDPQGTLVATKVQFKQVRVILHGRATAVDLAGRTLTVLGQTVHIDDLTRVDARSSEGNSESLADIVPNVDCVEIRGLEDDDRIVAREVKEPSGCGDARVQGRVSGEDGETGLTFFGNLNATLAGNVQFRDARDAAISRTAFFQAVQPAVGDTLGTLVKVRGTFAGGTLAVSEAELED